MANTDQLNDVDNFPILSQKDAEKLAAQRVLEFQKIVHEKFREYMVAGVPSALITDDARSAMLEEQSKTSQCLGDLAAKTHSKIFGKDLQNLPERQTKGFLPGK